MLGNSHQIVHSRSFLFGETQNNASQSPMVPTTNNAVEQKQAIFKTSKHAYEFPFGAQVPFELSSANSKVTLTTICNSSICVLGYDTESDAFICKQFRCSIQTLCAMWCINSRKIDKNVLDDFVVADSFHLKFGSHPCLKVVGSKVVAPMQNLSWQP